MAKSASRQLAFWIPWLAITYMALTPIEHAVAERVWDKALHVGAFFYLTGALWLAYNRAIGPWTVAGLLLGYGVAIELIQAFIPNRYFSALDLVADGIGIAIGLVAIAAAVGGGARWIRRRA